MSNSASLARTLEAMRDAGRLEPIDEALVTAAATLATAVDADPSNASLWREYRAALSAVMELDRADDDAYHDLLEQLQAPVRREVDSGAP